MRCRNKSQRSSEVVEDCRAGWLSRVGDPAQLGRCSRGRNVPRWLKVAGGGLCSNLGSSCSRAEFWGATCSTRCRRRLNPAAGPWGRGKPMLSLNASTGLLPVPLTRAAERLNPEEQKCFKLSAGSGIHLLGLLLDRMQMQSCAGDGCWRVLRLE